MRTRIFGGLKLVVTASTLAFGMLSGAVNASPTVSGNVISWSEPGWHQVQVQSSYETVCNGGRQCTVPVGVYTVINHGTGERFANIAITGINGDDVSGPPAPVAATGQLTSYAFGDDGDFQAGIAVPGSRFQDNEDGTFTDALTGIIWLGIRNCLIRFSWGSAVEYANNLNANSDACPNLNDDSVAGDWRLPNIKELYSLIDVTQSTPALPPEIPFTGEWTDSPWDEYWSSSTFQPATSNALVLWLGFGLIQSWSKDQVFSTWPIRVEN